MHQISEYIENPNLALMDAFQMESFRNFMEESDIEIMVVDRGDGTQEHVQALSMRSLNQVLRRIFVQCEESGINLKRWICSKDEFDLCAKFELPIGKKMRQLDEFLKSKKTQISLVGLDVVLFIFSAATLGFFLTLVAVLGLLNNYLIELCNCPFTV